MAVPANATGTNPLHFPDNLALASSPTPEMAWATEVQLAFSLSESVDSAEASIVMTLCKLTMQIHATLKSRAPALLKNLTRSCGSGGHGENGKNEEEFAIHFLAVSGFNADCR